MPAGRNDHFHRNVCLETTYQHRFRATGLTEPCRGALIVSGARIRLWRNRLPADPIFWPDDSTLRWCVGERGNGPERSVPLRLLGGYAALPPRLLNNIRGSWRSSNSQNRRRLRPALMLSEATRHAHASAPNDRTNAAVGCTPRSTILRYVARSQPTTTPIAQTERMGFSPTNRSAFGHPSGR